MKRSCQRHTGLRLPVRRMISLLPTPSALKERSQPPDMLVRVAVPRYRLQTAAISRFKSNGDLRFACARLACIQVPGIPSGHFKCQTRSTSASGIMSLISSDLT